MSDELTPELKKKLEELPRERMPAGLEARVTGAMRERGFLGKPRRVIAITGGRMAGLVAACVALVIGGYSIGLNRGGGAEQILPTVTVTERDETAGRAAQASDAPEPKKEAPGTFESFEAMPPPSQPARAKAPESNEIGKLSDFAKQQDVAPRTDRDRVAQAPAKERAEGLSSREAAEEATAEYEERAAKPAPSFQKSGAQPPVETPASPGVVAERPVTKTPGRMFMLNGIPIMVDAPDSVRIVEDENGRLLRIYTSDGVIQIRLSNDD